MRITTGTQMKQVDHIAIHKRGIPGLTLMEEAGKALAMSAMEMLPRSNGSLVVIVCGAGNNAGDGYVAARHLRQRKIPVVVFSTIDPRDLSGDALVNYEQYQAMDEEIGLLHRNEVFLHFEEMLQSSGVVIDAIFGTGLSRIVKGVAAKTIEAINQVDKFILSADIPSGIGADDGRIYGEAVRATETIAFQMPKLGSMIDPGKSCSGELKVVDIGIPEDICASISDQYFQIGKQEAEELIQKRLRQMNKGDAGKVLTIAGSKGMAGAAVLCALAGMRSGAGLVKVAACWEVIQVVQNTIPEATCLILEGSVNNKREQIFEEIGNFDAIAIGPGIGKNEENRKLIEHIIRKSDKPLIIDADGINCLAENTDVLREAKASVILTPHSKEMGRLVGKSAKEVNEDRITIAKTFANEYNVTLILKGADSLVAVPKNRVYINATGNPGMATGGSGDVLTGIVAAFSAAGMDAERAAYLGAYIHGLAGDIKARQIGEYGMIASDIAESVAIAIGRTTGELP